MPATPTTRQVLADAWKGIGNFIGLATADPGNSATPQSEAAGGAPAYARVATTWTSGTGGVVTGSAVSINGGAPSYPAAFTHAIVCTASTGNNMFHSTQIGRTELVGNAPIIVTPSITVQ